MFDIIEECSPGPYLELFARFPRAGWDQWGNEDVEENSFRGSAKRNGHAEPRGVVESQLRLFDAPCGRKQAKALPA